MVREPEFIPTIYVTDPMKCELVNSSDQTDVVKQGSKEWNDLFCSPFAELLKQKQKNQKCLKWE